MLLKYTLIRVQITVDEDNIRSINAVKRIGAVHEGILRNNYVVEVSILI